ncbi:pentapeptide repeat-containing protein [Fortiea sp. LEGE XX443]|uniref:pentapeptide repeat-containing protein n=1 Tax=Fortiea sp. LEGE XX443 TaxID=1828611 RepID=UPI00187F7709|nr:pentapeptide repeat-containing protein [Fortiea sp. LEGE XX443]MBE9004314.1 pentapeptide repeat-containing protein [Fortiea sp. LEGE XX443]
MSVSSESGTPISKPVRFWRKPPKLEFKELFKSLSKAAIDGVLGNWQEVAKDAVEASAAIGWAQTPEEIGWLLVSRSLIQAMLSLVEENRTLLFETPNQSDLELLYSRLNESLESQELHIDQEFFNNPKDLPILATINSAFGNWLQYFSLNTVQAQTISDRLPTYFIFALHQEWAEHPDKYACLKAEVDTPFTQANEQERSWLRYAAWLQKQVAEPIFDETFGLEKVYIPLRAYYKIPIKPQKDSYSYRQHQEAEKFEQVVVDLKTELEAWLNKAAPQDAIRVISGGPGSGKSSFAKIFAAEQAAIAEIQVLFIPLHRFEVEDNLVNAVGEFVKANGFLQHNPLEDNDKSRLLIIFDGLDELAMQGKLGAEVAKQFIQKVERKLDNSNQHQTCLQVLITGRELVVQANTNQFDKSAKEILHILPYFIPEDERSKYKDENKLLDADQRQSWWQKYSQAKDKQYNALPAALDQGKLIEITAQPLLNYLVALSYDRGEVKFSENSNLNTIYADLLKAVYERRWGDKQKHPIAQEFSIEDDEAFALILEEIALACWHGNGRTTTVSKIEKKCGANSHINQLFREYQQAAEAGVTRLLTAFYFRQSGVQEQEKTFEFTHKSFGEYLTARHIVHELIWIHKQLEERQKDRYHRKGWDETEALKNWVILCGTSPIDKYLFDFICDEIRLQDSADVENWQQSLCQLIGFMLRHGMPMELLPEIKSFHQANQQARNAEEALLVVLNACARVTQKISKIEWPSLETSEASEEAKASNVFGAWISRLHGQRVSWSADVLCLNCLSFLDLQNCILTTKDFYKANLVGADLEGAYLREANLEGAYLEGAYLEGAYLRGASLQRANLEGASLQRADLPGAYLEGAYLQRAYLQRADLRGANLQGAYLEGAYLEGAYLQGANLREAIVEWPRLLPANFEDEDITNFDDDSNSDE